LTIFKKITKPLNYRSVDMIKRRKGKPSKDLKKEARKRIKEDCI